MKRRPGGEDWAARMPGLLAACTRTAAQAWLGYVPAGLPSGGPSADAQDAAPSTSQAEAAGSSSDAQSAKQGTTLAQARPAGPEDSAAATMGPVRGDGVAGKWGLYGGVVQYLSAPQQPAGSTGRSSGAATASEDLLRDTGTAQGGGLAGAADELTGMSGRLQAQALVSGSGRAVVRCEVHPTVPLVLSTGTHQSPHTGHSGSGFKLAQTLLWHVAPEWVVMMSCHRRGMTPTWVHAGGGATTGRRPRRRVAGGWVCRSPAWPPRCSGGHPPSCRTWPSAWLKASQRPTWRRPAQARVRSDKIPRLAGLPSLM